jgi:hypothetical protein
MKVLVYTSCLLKRFFELQITQVVLKVVEMVEEMMMILVVQKL